VCESIEKETKVMGVGKLIGNTLFTSIIIVLFVISGILANVAWLCLTPLWFINRHLYRSYCKHITTAWFRIIIFIPVVWGGSKCTLYTSDKLEEVCGKESAIFIANHRYTHDWLLDFIAADRYDMLGQCKAFIKSEVAAVPLLGWAMWFNEFGFLTRSKSKQDLATLHQASAHFRSYTEPVWLLLYPEGTRFTDEKHQASVEFAKSKNIAHYNNLLVPRAKGFNELTSSLKGSNVSAIYDCTFFMENDYDVPLPHWLRGNPSNYSVVVTRIDLDQVPTDADEAKRFLNDLFAEKDALLNQMMTNPTADSFVIETSRFYNEPMVKRPMSPKQYWRPFLTTAVWFAIIMLPLIRMCLMYALASFKHFRNFVLIMITMNMAVLAFINFVTGKSNYGKKENKKKQ